MSDYEAKIKKIQLDNELTMKEKEFELKYKKDKELQEAAENVTKLQSENAVLKKENEMLGQVVDLNKDVIDVKELVKSLIKKLPEINISSIIAGNKQE